MRSGECEVFLCEDGQAGRGQGLEVTWPPTDMPWHVREMHVRHPEGHVFRLSQGKE